MAQQLQWQSNAHSNSDANTNTDPDAQSDADADSYADANSFSDADADTESESESITKSVPKPFARSWCRFGWLQPDADRHPALVGHGPVGFTGSTRRD